MAEAAPSRAAASRQAPTDAPGARRTAARIAEGLEWGKGKAAGGHGTYIPLTSEGLCTSTIVLTELLHGAAKSARPAENRRAVEDFAARLEVLPFEEAAAGNLGEFRPVEGLRCENCLG